MKCVSKVVLEPTNARPHYDTMAASTISSALVESRGSCAALTALVLALTEPLGEPFEAVVLKDHVVIGSVENTDEFFELLKQGERQSEAAVLIQAQQPGGPLRVGGSDYPPYYLDNLAARLAENGDVELAERLFKRALALAPGAARLRFNYGTFLVQEGENAAGEQQLSMAIDLGWIDADAFVNRGVAC